MTEQEQFLDVIDRDEAERRFHKHLTLTPLGAELVPLELALGRVLATNIVAPMDVPNFDRSNYDGFAVQAAGTFGADEQNPTSFTLLEHAIATAVVPDTEVTAGNAVSIATGAMLPRGADAVLMVEHADLEEGRLWARKAIPPGFGVSFAGTDVAAGETVLRRSEVLTSRETGVLAAIGVAQASVWKRPRVAIISTGDEIIAPGQKIRPGLIYDSNARIVADAVLELGGLPVPFGIVADDLNQLRAKIREAIEQCDCVLISGGTSKGAGDLSYRVVAELSDPGIVAHGVALKPGKPICLAVTDRKPVVILPGFPTSAIFTFHEFVAPVLRRMGGRPVETRGRVAAKMAVKVNSEIGRTEYLLVGLVPPAPPTGGSTDDALLVAFPMGKGSGSVTAFSRADGFVTISRHQEIVEAQTLVEVQLLGRDVQAADLVVIGSHCLGLDLLLGKLQDGGVRVKFLAVGSTAGLEAVRRGQCDLAGIHLLDPASGQYNLPFLDDSVKSLGSYGRLQGVVVRPEDARFEFDSAEESIEWALQTDCLMVNRNQGSGTRILIDRLLKDRRPRGYAIQSRSHNAVVAAVSQGRADWGIAIETAAKQAQLRFQPLVEEQFDLVAPISRLGREPVRQLAELLENKAIRAELRELGFRLDA